MNNKESEEKEGFVTTFQVMRSVFSSMIGVQKEENLKRDFQYGKPSQFIVVGLVMTIAFIFFVYGLVQLAFWYFGV